MTVVETASRPRDEVFGCGEDRHIRPGFRKHLDSSKRVFIEAGHGSDKSWVSFVGIIETKDFPFYFILVMFWFIDVVWALTKLDCLFMGDGIANGCLNLFDWSFALVIHKRCHFKSFPGVLQDVFRDGTGGSSKDI